MVRLRATGNRANALHFDLGRGGKPPHHAIERISPHHRRGRDIAAGRVPYPAGGAVLRQVAVEVQRAVEDHTTHLALGFDDDGVEALRGGIEAEV